jgi:hypothetical protein
MYLAVKLDIPLPPSKFSLLEVAPRFISGSLHTKKNNKG